MPTQKPRSLHRIEYEVAGEKYVRSLPPEHFMEATAQARQREITLASLALVNARRPEVQVFNELLVQYPRRGQGKFGQVVPDIMVVVWREPIQANGNYDIPFQPVGPLWMLEYGSKHNKRKDYEDNMRKYERELKVPYYLLFYPDASEMTLYQMVGRTYRSAPPNAQGRHAIEPLDLEVGLFEDWVRFWYKGELLPLPAELHRALDETERQLRRMKRIAKQQTRRAEEQTRCAEAERQARRAAEEEVQRLRAELEKLREAK